MKRKIAAVLMADVAGMSRALAADEGVALKRLEDHRAVIEEIATRGGGQVLPAVSEALLVEFQSAVEAVRAAVEAQETLRARNKALSLAERLEYRIAITIGEVGGRVDGTPEVSPETLSGAAHLVSLAIPGGVCISRSVREAVASKLKLKFQDISVEGEVIEAETPSTYRVASERPEPPARPPVGKAAKARKPMVLAGGALLVALGVVTELTLLGGNTGAPKPKGTQEVTVLTPAPPAGAATQPEAKPQKPSGGSLELLPAHAPDPADVLTAKRMLPQAWKACREGSADAAVVACKTVIDSGLAKGEELAELHVFNGKALRERRELDKALEALSAAITLKPTPAAYSLRGTVHYDKGNWDKAISDYSEAIRLDTSNGEAFNNRAWTYYRTGRSDKALSDADAAVRLLSKQAYVWDTRAHIHAALGNREAAISDFRAALAIDPGNAESKAGLAKLGVN